MTAKSASEVGGDAYAEGFDDGYDEGWREASQDVDRVEREAYDAGFLAGRSDPDLDGLLREAVKEAGGDLLEGVFLRWDAAERRLVIEPASRLEARS